MKVTTTMHAYIGEHSKVMPQDLQTAEGLQKLSYFATDSKFWREQGYTYVGPATVTIEVPELRELVENKVAALREEAAATRAKATARCTEIESQIQSLLAIEFTPAAEQPSAEA